MAATSITARSAMSSPRSCSLGWQDDVAWLNPRSAEKHRFCAKMRASNGIPSAMSLRHPTQLVAAALLVFGCAPANAVMRLVVEQVGSDVVMSGSGTANTSGLASSGSVSDFTNVYTYSQAYAGPAAFDNGAVSFWSGLSGPTVFGSDQDVTENPDQATSTGQLFGILAGSNTGSPQLVLPADYSSGSSLSGVSTFTSLTLSQLGLTPGQTFTWSWGSGLTADSLQLEVSSTVPAPLPMLLAAGVFSGVSRIRRLSKRLHSQVPD